MPRLPGCRRRSSMPSRQSEWRSINGDDASTRFSPLAQIDASNFNRLKVAWEWKGKDSPASISAGHQRPRSLPIYATAC